MTLNLTRIAARRCTSAVLCATGAALGILAFAAAAHAAEAWYDTAPEYSLITDCVTGNPVDGAGAYVGVLRDPAAPPSAGSVFYARTVAAPIGNACAGQAVRFEVTLPPGASVAISPSTPVRCFTRVISTGVATPVPATRCPQTTSVPLYGGSVAFDPADTGSDPTWDLFDGIAIEIQFPVVAALPLAGFGVTPCHCLKAFTKVLDTEANPVLMPYIDLVATAGAPAAPITPPPAAPPPPPAAAADTAPPAAKLTGSASQKLGKTVAVSISCSSEACKATASGTVLVPKAGSVKAKTYKLPALTESIAQGAKATARLKLNATPRAAIKRALRAGKRVVVKLRVRIADASGNTRTLTRQVRLKL